MAERPIFVPAPIESDLVREIYFQLRWNPGFAEVQKRKNIRALHEAAAVAGYVPLLEVSTKSDHKVGQHLSAFHLKVHSKTLGDIPLESAYQGSKVFEAGGPYTDLYSADALAAKRDIRLKDSGPLVGFVFDDARFALEPKTAFYDWLYITAIYPHRDWLQRLLQYKGFTDIEFNPERSINCQARSCALFVALMAKKLLDSAVQSPRAFSEVLAVHSYPPKSHAVRQDTQEAFFKNR
jgi:hypothetical protein